MHECKPRRSSGHVRWEEFAESGVFLVTHDKDKHISSSYLFLFGATDISYNYKMTMVIESVWGIVKPGHTCLTHTWLSSFWPASVLIQYIYIKATMGSILNIICGLKWIFGGKVLQLSCVDRKNMNTHIYKGKILRELMSIVQALLINAVYLILGSDWYFSIYKPFMY